MRVDSQTELVIAADIAERLGISRQRVNVLVSSPMVEVADTCPREDRTLERRVFPGFTPDAVRASMMRACKAAGIPHYHPHDLRHRYASVKIAEGVPVTVVSAQLGHAKKSLTLDTYSHVVVGD